MNQYLAWSATRWPSLCLFTPTQLCIIIRPDWSDIIITSITYCHHHTPSDETTLQSNPWSNGYKVHQRCQLFNHLGGWIRDHISQNGIRTHLPQKGKQKTPWRFCSVSFGTYLSIRLEATLIVSGSPLVKVSLEKRGGGETKVYGKQDWINLFGELGIGRLAHNWRLPLIQLFITRFDG